MSSSSSEKVSLHNQRLPPTPQSVPQALAMRVVGWPRLESKVLPFKDRYSQLRFSTFQGWYLPSFNHTYLIGALTHRHSFYILLYVYQMYIIRQRTTGVLFFLKFYGHHHAAPIMYPSSMSHIRRGA